jgi:hypothetical protein
VAIDKQNILIWGAAAAVFGALAIILALFILGGSSFSEPARIEKGVEVVDVPFTGNGQEYVPVKWMVKGSTDTPIISGVFFSQVPSKANFVQNPPPDQTGYENFVPYGIVSENNTDVFEAMVPSAYERTYVRIYAKVNGDNYWSDEFVITP